MNEYVKQIYELIDKKTEELLQQEKQDSSSFMTRYDYVRSRITMFLLDCYIDFLDKANKGTLEERDVKYIKFYLSFLESMKGLETIVKWYEMRKKRRKHGK